MNDYPPESEFCWRLPVSRPKANTKAQTSAQADVIPDSLLGGLGSGIAALGSKTEPALFPTAILGRLAQFGSKPKFVVEINAPSEADGAIAKDLFIKNNPTIMGDFTVYFEDPTGELAKQAKESVQAWKDQFLNLWTAPEK